MPAENIQLLSSLVTAAVAVLSVAIAVFTLRQTNRITEEANRPYIVLYSESVRVTSTPVTYLVIKNFGKTGAVIDSVTHSPSFENRYGVKPFAKLTNFFIAPSQAISTACHIETDNPIIFTIKYKSREKSFCESFTINHLAISENVIVKTSSSSDSLEKTVSYAAQELIRTNL